jgi:class 3 adenylate cyclase
MSGPVTLLFTDIEGSIRLWEADPEAMAEASGRHNRIVREQIEVSGGHVFKTVGEARPPCPAIDPPRSDRLVL